MREIKNIVIHCTATRSTATVESILNYWKDSLGWKSPGYHFIIESNGNVVQLHPLSKCSNGVRGHNNNSVNISYIGGVDSEGNPKDTRTPQQLYAMAALIKAMKGFYPDADIKGHRDFEGVNKACPSFEVSEYLKTIGL